MPGDASIGPPIVRLDDRRATAAELTGGKGAVLARLSAAGHAVPDGFCVTTRVFAALVDDGVRRRLREVEALDPTSDALEEATRTVRAAIAARPLPRAVEEAILAGYTALGGRAVAVRSSATVEDLPHASAAGQHDTHLNVRSAAAVVQAVRSCMASLFTARAVAYRARRGVPRERVAMAVVVQRMVDADAAGVLFTADPGTGDRRSSVIDAAFGLGDAVVSGAVSTDHARVDDRAGAVTYEVGDKRVATRGGDDGGVVEVELPASQRTARVLTDEQVLQLARTGRAIEGLLGAPQDIEWAWAGGHLWVLQARPITSLFPVPRPTPADDALHVYLSVGHMQAFAEAMPPLAADAWKNLISAWTDRGHRAGGASFAMAGGRVYLDVTRALASSDLSELLLAPYSPLGDQAVAGLHDLLARRGTDIRRIPPRRRGAWVAPTLRAAPALLPRLPRFVGRLLRAVAGGAARPRDEAAWYEAWGRGLAAAARAPDQPRERARRTLRGPLGVPDLADLYARLAPLLAALSVPPALAGLVPDAEAERNAIGGGFAHDVVTRINQGLGDLADMARRHPAVAEAIAGGAALDELAGVNGGQAFIARFAAYLDEFGHRAAGEIDLSRPRWREDPRQLLTTVRAALADMEIGRHRAHLRSIVREAAEATRALERRARRGPSGMLRARFVRHLVRVHRNGIWMRELPKHGMAHGFAAWRETLLEAGEELAARGDLPTADDVWLLHSNELLAALDGGMPRIDLAARRAELAHHRQLDAPLLITSDGERPAVTGRPDVAEGTLVGTPVSGGVVEGIARVVRDPAVDGIAPGEILVALSTDPGWTTLFLNAAGLVTEVGGRFSHGAIVAREYRLPAVVSAPNATSRIRSGDRVRLDGTRGTVEVLTPGDG